MEGEENFFVNLMGNPGLVQADPNLATVVITEDTTDSECRLVQCLACRQLCISMDCLSSAKSRRLGTM